jgi:hypothetical protein
MTFSEDWESTAMRFNAMIDDWFSYSPTKGKAGKNLITFRVSTNENILDDGVISFTFNDNEFVDIEIYKGYSDDMDLTISGEPISNLNLSNFKQLRYLGIASTSVFSLDLSECSYLEYVYTGSDDGDTSNGINKILTEIWLREGQDVEFEGDGNYEVKYK